MKKTVSINISGVVFNIEEDAYEDLKRYLDTIAGYFQGSESQEEIMTDIESRIAELFQERLSASKNVVNGQDVQDVISIMGRPEDYLGDEDIPYAGQASGDHRRSQHKRFYRDTDHNLIGGVCAGVSNYFGWDPLWVRLAWGLSIGVAGVGVLPYIILWALIPEASTTAEKLEMMGEPVTVDTIKKKVDETLKSFDDKSFDSKFHASHARTQVAKGGNLLVDVIKRIVHAFGKVLGFLFFFGGLLVLGGMIYSYFEGSLFSINAQAMGGEFQDFSSLREMLFTSSLSAYTFFIGTLLFLVTPIIGILMLGTRLLFNLKKSGRYTRSILFSLFVLGLVMVLIASIPLGMEFSKQRDHTETSLVNDAGAALRLSVMSDPYFSDSHDYDEDWDFSEFIQLRGDSIYCSDPSLRIVRAPADAEVSFSVEAKGTGHTGALAQLRAENINYRYQESGGAITLAPYFSYAKEDKFRAQEIEVTLRVPIGRKIMLTESIKRMLSRAERDDHIRLRDLPGKEWLMTSRGLSDVIQTLKIPVALPDSQAKE